MAFFSGFCGLAYELVWIRVLSVVFGRTTLSTAIVVAVYMAGLGFGGLFWGKKIDTGKRPLRLFAVLQWIIGGACLLIAFLFSALPGLYKGLYHALQVGFETPTMLAFALSFGLMFVPAFAMGGTLPVLAKYAVDKGQPLGGAIGKLYALHTFGSIAGAALVGYYLIGWFGQLRTQLLAVLINLVLGGIAFFIAFKSSRPALKPASSTPAPQHALWTPKRGIRRLLLLVAGLNGFCALSFEILIARALSTFIVNSTYGFTSILVIFLLGIGLGSVVFTRFFSRSPRLLTILAAVELCLGLYVATTVFYLNELPAFLFSLEQSLFKIPVAKTLVPGLALSALLLLIPAVLMGMGFPLICKGIAGKKERLGIGIGAAYFASTAGSIAGSLGAALVFIPKFGVAASIVAMGSTYLFLGGVVGLTITKKPYKRAAVCCSMLSIGAIIILGPALLEKTIIHPPSIFRSEVISDEILFYKETTDGTVLVREDTATNIRSLYVNNNQVCGVTYDALNVVKMLGHLPFLVSPSAKKVLVIGFGIGVTTAEIAKHPVEQIDCVEIAPGVKEAATYFEDVNRGVIEDPRLRFMAGDGRNYLLLTEETYDIISSDPTHPTLGCANLYTIEYFELNRARLSPEGVVVQYLPLHRMTLAALKSTVKTFQAVFPHATLWMAHSHAVMLGTQGALQFDVEKSAAVLAGIGDFMMQDAYGVASALLLDAAGLAAFSKGGQIHRDDRPFLEYYSFKSIGRENWRMNLEHILKFRSDLKGVVTADDWTRLSRYMKQRTLFLNGLIQKDMGALKRAGALFSAAMRVNPENKEIERFLIYETWLHRTRQGTN